MNYVSVDMIRYAAAIIAATEQFKAEHPEVPGGLVCTWQADPGSPPCGEPAEYFVPDATRVSAGGDIEASPQWYCRGHLELVIGEPAREQPMFQRIESPGE